jgi:hypothetical protein
MTQIIEWLHRVIIVDGAIHAPICKGWYGEGAICMESSGSSLKDEQRSLCCCLGDSFSSVACVAVWEKASAL